MLSVVRQNIDMSYHAVYVNGAEKGFNYAVLKDKQDEITQIYERFAAKHGDGFELKAAVGEAGFDKNYAVIREFYRALHAAGLSETVGPPLSPARSHGLVAAFFAEKYGLAGLDADAQCAKIMGKLRTCSAEDVRAAAQLLYNVGALSLLKTTALKDVAAATATAHLLGSGSPEENAAALNTIRNWGDSLVEFLASFRDA